MPSMRSLALAPLTAILLCSATALHAQESQQEKASISLNQFNPSPAGDTFFSIPSPFANGEIVEPRAKITVEGASDPLRLLQGEGDNAEVGAIVSTQMFMHINLSAGILDRALLSVQLPIALRQSGDSPTAEGLQATSPDSSQLGDLRLGLRIRLYGEYDSYFQIGTGGFLWVPTGPEGSFVSEGAVRVTPYASIGGAFDLGTKWRWTATGGAEIRGGDNPSKVRYGAGLAAVLFDDLIHIGPEIFAATPVQDSTNFRITEGRDVGQQSGTNVELLLGTRVRVWHFTAGAAGGPGLTKAIGTPAFRLTASLSYEPLPDDEDRSRMDDDDDGIENRSDACPHAFGQHDADPKRHGCPSYDDDEDGIPNHRDGCPDEYGPSNADPKLNGCRQADPVEPPAAEPPAAEPPAAEPPAVAPTL